MTPPTNHKNPKPRGIAPVVVELTALFILCILLYVFFRAVDWPDTLYAVPQRNEIIAGCFTLTLSLGVFSFYKWRKAERRSLAARESAARDSLTGLYNRRVVDEIVSAELDRSKRFDLEFSVVMMDIDNFKMINDALGHRAGDEVLKEVSAIISRNIRKLDSAIRWGGEEFVIVCPETQKNGALELAEKLRKKIECHPFLTAGPITASFGVVFGTQNETVDSLIQKVDEALYAAKEQGKNRVVVF